MFLIHRNSIKSNLKGNVFHVFNSFISLNKKYLLFIATIKLQVIFKVSFSVRIREQKSQQITSKSQQVAHQVKITYSSKTKKVIHTQIKVKFILKKLLKVSILQGQQQKQQVMDYFKVFYYLKQSSIKQTFILSEILYFCIKWHFHFFHCFLIVSLFHCFSILWLFDHFYEAQFLPDCSGGKEERNL